MKRKFLIYLSVLLISFHLISCRSVPEEFQETNRAATMEPDYSGLVIPVNIAPLNFHIEEEGTAFHVELIGANGTLLSASSKNGTVKFPAKKWKKLLESNVNGSLEYRIYAERKDGWVRFVPFSNEVSEHKIDPFLYYRLLYPGYESWAEISIVQRSMENFREKTVVANNVVGQNCVNCHAFNQQRPQDFMFHMRGNKGGTYFISDGDLLKFDLKTKELENGATYPRWHPSGKYVAFSSNKVVQQFHAVESKKIEVSDLNSSLVLYDLAKNEIGPVPVDQGKEFMDTYPEWSPDGRTLYFCRAAQIGPGYDYRDTKYNLCRVDFNPESKKFGVTEVIFNAASLGKSVSFPRISPDGETLVFTYHDYGCFSIWHKEADLYSINLKDLSVEKLESNSDFTESYHSWSSNGKWLVFSSKRGDGLTARPYISYVDDTGKTKKPFVLPQEDPKFYSTFIKTFNVPELAQSEVSFTPGKIRRAAKKTAIKANWSDKR